MLTDIRQLTDGSRIESDVCFVGAGAAGITLARELGNLGRKVCLLESGGLENDDDTQDLYDGEDIGIPYPVYGSRLRFFGGSTNHWAGWCQPLDPIDFEARSWVSHSGWPIAYDDVFPYYVRAQEVVELGPFNYDPGYWEQFYKDRGYKRFPLAESRVSTKLWHLSPPTRFGKVYRDEIEKSDTISAYLYANVVDILTDENARQVTGLKVASLDGKSFEVTGNTYVLATGGIENPRLLLTADGVQKEGLGNGNDLVGRFFMEHPRVTVAHLMLPNKDNAAAFYLDNWDTSNERQVLACMSLTADIQESERLLNYSSNLVPVSPGADSDGYGSLREIVGGWRKEQVPDNLSEHIGNIIADLDDVASALYGRFFGAGESRLFRMEARTEQAPNPDSRVLLAAERDALGMRRIDLDWRMTDRDMYSIVRSTGILGQEFGRAGLGRIKTSLSENDDDWPLYLSGGNHHMGTTRMADDAKRGVVDKNCRVHGIDKLYVAGSSVFPTCGYANPTLTIVALALRLADHFGGNS
ncbi:MAG: GMC family oxidoreductase [Alphaproteobacteria bacterium]|nr:GMC family oxidoreductase [Alphaproteobacteria bacterium]